MSGLPRNGFRSRFREILKREGSTAIMVTHDQNEAFAMADEIGIMHEGRIQQWDVPYNLYHRPANRFVADFIGQGVLLPGVVAGRHQCRHGTRPTGFRHCRQNCSETCANCADGCDVDVLLRPDDIVHDDKSALQAEVLHKAFRGADILYTLRLNSGAEVSIAGAIAPQSCDWRKDRHPARCRPRHRLQEAERQTRMIPYLGPLDLFPPVELAREDMGGLLAVGGDLQPDRLLESLPAGNLPVGHGGRATPVVQPGPAHGSFSRGIRLTRSLQKTLRAGKFEVRFDTNFPDVMAGCASTPRPGQDGTWITPEMKQRLHPPA